MVENNTRLRKEYNLIPTSDNFKGVFGTTNRILPTVIYVKLNTWVKYTGDIKDYSENINTLNSIIRNNIKQEIKIANNFTDMFFYTPNIKKVMSKTTTTFHACFEITLRQKEPVLHEISLLSTKLGIMTNNLLKTIEKNSYFEFSKIKNGNH